MKEIEELIKEKEYKTIRVKSNFIE